MDDDNDGVCDKCGTVLRENESKLNGYYLLTYKSQTSIETTDTYLYNYLELKDSTLKWHTVDMRGSSVQEGTYKLTSTGVTFEIGIKSYAFSYDSDAKTLSFTGSINKVNTSMVFTLEESFSEGTDKGNASFNSELFGDPIDENFYNYCPTIMYEGKDTIHIWYCSNKTDANDTDYIAYR